MSVKPKELFNYCIKQSPVTLFHMIVQLVSTPEPTKLAEHLPLLKGLCWDLLFKGATFLDQSTSTAPSRKMQVVGPEK